MNINSLIKMIGGTMVRSLVYKLGRRGTLATSIIMAIAGAILYAIAGKH